MNASTMISNRSGPDICFRSKRQSNAKWYPRVRDVLALKACPARYPHLSLLYALGSDTLRTSAYSAKLKEWTYTVPEPNVLLLNVQRRSQVKVGTEADHISPHMRRFSWMIISFTAAITNRICMVSVAQVKWVYICLVGCWLSLLFVSSKL